jgi:hypothetical protein
MAYIGKSPTGTGVRSRYYFTAAGGETSLSGADDSGATLSFTDGAYVDVSLNGIALVAGTDYNTSTANTIGGLSALSASDIVEVVVYDIFTVADTVSAKDGGTFSGNVAMGGTLSVTGASTLSGDLTVDTSTLHVDSTNNRVGVGTASPDVATHVVGGDGVTTLASYDAQTSLAVENNSDSQLAIIANSSNSSQLFFGDESSELVGRIRYDHSSNHMQFYTNASERMRIDSDGDFFFNTTTLNPSASNVTGTTIRLSGTIISCGNATAPLDLGRTTDGTMVAFRSAGNLEGSISISGTTTSYNGGHLARWSQLTDNTRDESIVKGTVMTNLDQMAEWTNDGVTEDNEQLNCMAVSLVEGDANVAGVFVNWDDDDDIYTNDMNVAMTGDMVIRIAQGTTVAQGDLLMSAGDGTAKPQGDDIVRSKTIAKVTSTHVSHTYDDGSYLVPCVLMAC